MQTPPTHVPMPFLVQFGDVVPIGSEVAGDQTDEATIANPEWFHTRCGHPRHRDD